MSNIIPLNPNSEKRSRLTVAQIYERNKEVVKNHKPLQHFADIAPTGVAAPPILILTCADLRCEPEHYFNLKRYEAVIIRGIGGRVEPQLAGILGVDWLFEFKEFAIVHHTDCGTLHFDGLRERVKERAHGDQRVDALDFGATTDVKDSVRRDLKFFRDCPYVRKELRRNSYGFVYDIKTGELTPVQPSEDGRL